MSRLESLKNLVQQDQANERIRFMLCMEYASTGDYAGALSELDELIARHPGYAPLISRRDAVAETLENTPPPATTTRAESKPRNTPAIPMPQPR